MDNSDVLMLVLGAVVVGYAFSSFSDPQETVVYMSYCSDFKHNFYSCPKNESINVMKMHYKISFEQQVVVPKNTDIYQIYKCMVFDKGNWSCDLKNGNSFSMNDGRFSEIQKGVDYNNSSIDEKGQPSILPRYLQISSFEYNIRSVGEFFRSLK